MSNFARTLNCFGGMGRVALALLFAAFVLAPSFDFECATEGFSLSPPSTQAAELASNPIAKAPAPTPASPDRQTCPHGHCHHGVIANLREDTVASVEPVEHAVHFRSASAAATSPSSNRLDRPPRA